MHRIVLLAYRKSIVLMPGLRLSDLRLSDLAIYWYKATAAGTAATLSLCGALVIAREPVTPKLAMAGHKTSTGLHKMAAGVIWSGIRIWGRKGLDYNINCTYQILSTFPARTTTQRLFRHSSQKELA